MISGDIRMPFELMLAARKLAAYLIIAVCPIARLTDVRTWRGRPASEAARIAQMSDELLMLAAVYPAVAAVGGGESSDVPHRA
jgi:hypothetical protein